MAANRQERKARMAAFLRLQFDRSMAMLQADSLWGGSGAHSHLENFQQQQQQQVAMSKQQLKEERERKQMEDMSMFLYRLESDFEDKKRRLEKMLFENPVILSPSVCPLCLVSIAFKALMSTLHLLS